MMIKRARRSTALLLALSALLTAPQASAQIAQGAPIRIVVPLATGGGGDIVARMIAGKLQEILGQPVNVENKPGGGTSIGTDMVAKSAGDGRNLVLATSSHVVNPSILARLPFDPVKDFAGVSLIATAPLLLVVNAKTPARSVTELVALARSQPNGMTFASSGIGSLPHLSGELLARVGGARLTHVPYKGSGPAEVDLIGGQVDMFFASPASVISHIQNGRLRALAISTGQRSPAFPDIPAVAETYPGFESGTLYALLAPAATPRPILQALSQAVRKATELPDVQDRLDKMGAIRVASTPEDTMKFIETQIALWARVVKEAGIKAD